MVESPSSAATATIQAVRQELCRFQSQQRDAAVLLRCAAIDVYLAGALQGRAEPWLRKTLASKVKKLAEALHNAHYSSQDENVVESRSHVTSVMIETLGTDFADPVGVA